MTLFQKIKILSLRRQWVKCFVSDFWRKTKHSQQTLLYLKALDNTQFRLKKSPSADMVICGRFSIVMIIVRTKYIYFFIHMNIFTYLCGRKYIARTCKGGSCTCWNYKYRWCCCERMRRESCSCAQLSPSWLGWSGVALLSSSSNQELLFPT